MSNHSFRGAIFDLDGTLLDSMGVWESVDRIFLGKRGIELPNDYMQNITVLSFRSAAEYTIDRFDLHEKPEDLMQEWHTMAIDAYANRVPLKRGAYEFLKFLKGQDIPLGIATAAEEALFVPALKRCGVYDFFDHITTLREVKRGKGFPDIYEKAAEKMGFYPEECIVFEDIAAGIHGAKAGGFIAAAMYDAHALEDHLRMKQAADMFFMDFFEAMNHFTKVNGGDHEA